MKYYYYLKQRIIFYYWKYFETRTCKVFDMSKPNGYEIKKRSCPIVYYKRGNRSIAIDMYFFFGGFYSHHSPDGKILFFKK